MYQAQPEKGLAHRAGADIRESILELAYYRQTLFVPLSGIDHTLQLDSGESAFGDDWKRKARAIGDVGRLYRSHRCRFHDHCWHASGLARGNAFGRRRRQTGDPLARADAEAGELILYEDSYGLVTLAISNGNAARLTGVGVGDELRIAVA